MHCINSFLATTSSKSTHGYLSTKKEAILSPQRPRQAKSKREKKSIGRHSIMFLLSMKEHKNAKGNWKKKIFSIELWKVMVEMQNLLVVYMVKQNEPQVLHIIFLLFGIKNFVKFQFNWIFFIKFLFKIEEFKIF